MQALAFAVLVLALVEPAGTQRGAADPTGAALIRCAPTNYEAALHCLDAHLTADAKLNLKEPGGPVQAHFGLGTFIRNSWGLWGDGRLKKSMEARGFTHPEDMSGAILDGYSHRLRGEPFDLQASAARYRAYWTGADGNWEKAVEEGRAGQCPLPAAEDRKKLEAALIACANHLEQPVKGDQR